jgi:hypothetical protein
MRLAKILSGGQTGIDRGALDAAIACGFPCGGWCPPGRLVEDGRIPERYPLIELKEGGYWQRTLHNILESDGTAILYFSQIEGGTEETLLFCINERKPHKLIDAEEISAERATFLLASFIQPSRNALEGSRELVTLHWGLVLSWAKEPKIGYSTINTRAETVAEKPAFWKAFRYHRCLIAADGFYEWRRTGGPKQPYYIGPDDGKPFAFAGIWEHWAGQNATPRDEIQHTIVRAAIGFYDGSRFDPRKDIVDDHLIEPQVMVRFAIELMKLPSGVYGVSVSGA